MIGKEILLKFCDSNGHPKIDRPWSKDDKTYSTNGCLIIRIDRVSEIKEKEDAPDVIKLFNETLPSQEWLEIPELPDPEFKKCSVCNGKGYFETKRDFCEDCGGIGKIEILKLTGINGSVFQNKYLRLLKELPNCKISPTKHDKPAWFKFDEGDGLLMPYRR